MPKSKIIRSSRYFEHSKVSKKDIFRVRSGKRPTNQNTKRVRSKIVRLTKEEFSPSEMRDTTREFVANEEQGVSLSEGGFDIAHGMSINRISHSLAEAASQGNQARGFTRQYVQDAISSDEESDQEEIAEWADTFTDASKPIGQRMSALDKTAARINRTSRNLIGGDSSTNRSVSYHDDLATTRDGDVFPKMAMRRNVLRDFEKNLNIDEQQEEMFGSKLDSTGNPISSTFDYSSDASESEEEASMEDAEMVAEETEELVAILL